MALLTKASLIFALMALARGGPLPQDSTPHLKLEHAPAGALFLPRAPNVANNEFHNHWAWTHYSTTCTPTSTTTTTIKTTTTMTTTTMTTTTTTTIAAEVTTTAVTTVVPKLTTSSSSACAASSHVANYDDLGTGLLNTGLLSSSISDYEGLTYTGFAQNAAVLDLTIVQPASPPNVISANLVTGILLGSPGITPSTGTTYFSLTSVDYACVIDAAGAVNLPVDCTIQATGKTVGGTTVSTQFVFDSKSATATQMSLQNFPASFKQLTDVTFGIIDGLLDIVYTIELDNLAYTTYSC